MAADHGATCWRRPSSRSAPCRWTRPDDPSPARHHLDREGAGGHRPLRSHPSPASRTAAHITWACSRLRTSRRQSCESADEPVWTPIDSGREAANRARRGAPSGIACEIRVGWTKL
jgi:hypothetical protein